MLSKPWDPMRSPRHGDTSLCCPQSGHTPPLPDVKMFLAYEGSTGFLLFVASTSRETTFRDL
jgi:hypothetical protein